MAIIEKGGDTYVCTTPEDSFDLVVEVTRHSCGHKWTETWKMTEGDWDYMDIMCFSDAWCELACPECKKG